MRKSRQRTKGSLPALALFFQREDDQLAWIEDARDAGVIAESAADDQAILKHACGVFGEDALSGRIYASAEDAPLTAVGMTADGELDLRFLNIRYEILGMMTKKDAEAVLSSKARERFGVWLVLFLVDAGG